MNMWGAANHPVLAAVIGVLWLMAVIVIAMAVAAVLVGYFAYWSGPEAWRILARYRYDAAHRSAVT
jgi:hypothetical protein